MAFIWNNGDILPAEEKVALALDRGLLLGDGVFDTLKYTNGHIMFGTAHIERLARHAQAIHIKLTYKAEILLTAIETLIERNGWADQTCSVRTTVTRGVSKRGIQIQNDAVPNIVITASKYQESTDKNPLRLCIEPEIRRNETSPLSRIKTLNYLDAILVKDKAVKAGFDDAIILNFQGHVSCATTGNIFIKDENGRMVTPPLSDGVLDGVIREDLIRTSGAIEQSITIQDIEKSEKIWVTNSLIGQRGAIYMQF